MGYQIAFYTAVGKRRQNQDALLLKRARYRKKEILLAVVCDGLGGLEKGELASACVVKAFSVWFDQELPELLKRERKKGELHSSWQRLLQEVNERLRAYGKNYDLVLGTTVSAILFWNGRYELVHLGDCRIYEVRHRVSQLTKDQTVSGKQHILLQSIGVSKNLHPLYRRGKIKKEGVYILCTDGFWHKSGEKELLENFSLPSQKWETEMKKSCQRLTEYHFLCGEQDNSTVLAISYIGKKKKGPEKREAEYCAERRMSGGWKVSNFRCFGKRGNEYRLSDGG